MEAMRALGRGGLRVGPVSLGCAPIGNLGRALSDSEWRSSITQALVSGIGYFDTAPHYGLGLAEERLGQVLSEQPREQLIVSSKVGRLIVPTAGSGRVVDSEGFLVEDSRTRVLDYSRDGVLRSIEASLARLGLDRLDIVFVHDPDNHYEEALEGAFPTLAELQSEGVITSYGAGMNQAEMLSDFVRNTDLDVVMLAGRYTLLDQRGLDELLPLCEERGVSVVAAGVFNSGILATDRPQPEATYDYVTASPEMYRQAQVIADIAGDYGVSLPAVAAQFPLAHPAVATVCLGARSGEQVQRNVGLVDVRIPSELWADLVVAGVLRSDAPVDVRDRLGH